MLLKNFSSIKNQKNKKGQSLIEFIIAVALLVIITGSGATAILGSFSATRLAKEQTQALGYAAEGIEAVKSIRNQDWDNLANGTHGLSEALGYWEFSGTSDLLGSKYTREITIEDHYEETEVVPETKKITSNVFWNYTSSRATSVQLVTYLTNWQTQRADSPGGFMYGTCHDYCISIGYTAGACEQNPNVCKNKAELYVPYGDQYCLGGPSADSCCCGAGT